jgi:hypothetical protein
MLGGCFFNLAIAAALRKRGRSAFAAETFFLTDRAIPHGCA